MRQFAGGQHLFQITYSYTEVDSTCTVFLVLSGEQDVFSDAFRIFVRETLPPGVFIDSIVNLGDTYVTLPNAKAATAKDLDMEIGQETLKKIARA